MKKLQKLSMKKSIVNIIFITYVLICFLVTVWKSQQVSEQIIAERYGIEKKETFELTEETEVKVEFELNHNNFEGVQLKFRLWLSGRKNTRIFI